MPSRQGILLYLFCSVGTFIFARREVAGRTSKNTVVFVVFLKWENWFEQGSNKYTGLYTAYSGCKKQSDSQRIIVNHWYTYRYCGWGKINFSSYGVWLSLLW